MEQDAHGYENQQAATPAITAIKTDAGFGPEPYRHMMERSFSQDIQEGRKELQDAAEQTRNIILDLGLDGVIRWVSPSWTDVVGTDLEVVKGKPISTFIDDNPNVFEPAIAALSSNDSKSQFVKFAIKIGKSSDLERMLPEEERSTEADVDRLGNQELQVLRLEGQGIMVYDRASGGGSHTMWMLQPAAEPIHVTIALPQSLVESLGVGAEVLAKYLTELTEAAAQDPAHHPPPLPIVCRVCERSIVPWWFEKHSDLCVQEHKAEMDVQMVQESLADHRNAIVKILDAFEARKGRSAPSDSTAALAPGPEYKGLPIGPTSTPSSGLSTNPGSQTGSPVRSRSPSTFGLGLGHVRARSFAVRRPLIRVIELILDLCDTAIEINNPAIKETASEIGDDFRTLSPLSESRISQVLQWHHPNSLENEPGLAQLSMDTEKLAKAKVEAVHRHRVILEYSERIRQENHCEVDACIAEALDKAQRAAAGEPLSSSESEADPNELRGQTEELEGGEPEADEPTLLTLGSETVQSEPQPTATAMAAALRSHADPLPAALTDDRRSSSAAISTRSSSPLECPTPKSSRSFGTNLIAQPQPVASRRSLYLDADANDSDSSIPSSILSSNWRTDSPASDQPISRTTSSRDRKRRSLHLHGLGSGSPRRHHSPGRYPQPPPSPLRTTKSRIPSGDIAASPVVSPLLTTGEFMPPNVSGHHHRRQSSAHVPDGRSSPRLSSSNHPQQKVLPPSIKDFEIIKPISRGAFGSVYLSKKKLTGEYFAIKVLRKSDMVAKNQVTNVKAERAIMMWQGESDFVAKLYWTFSSKDYLYLVMEYLNGGDCASLIRILGGLSEDWAKKYIAEVVLGVQHLHSRGIVHRDLKPDNLLIDSKGHLKLTDFGLSRMGLVGRQKRALKGAEESVPDLLKHGPFTRSTSTATSRSASFDFHGTASPSQTPLMTPALTSGLEQPSYFSLNRESSLSREPSRRASGHRSDSGSLSSHDLHKAFRAFSISDAGESQTAALPISSRGGPIEEESYSQGSASPDLFPLSQSLSNISQVPPPSTTQMLPPPMALFDPQDTSRRFVGTPDYLAPETINGSGQDEMSDWWSLGCIIFEFLYGCPPFNAPTPEQVFENILHRKIAWPDEPEMEVSENAKDLINKLIQFHPQDRLGANRNERYPSGGAEIQAHPWFADINWETLLEDEAQFVPNPENPEDTEYFDARGATLASFPEELEDQLSPSGLTPGESEVPDRPHDALSRARNFMNSVKRGLMPLHIPAHVARDSRNRRLSEPVVADDFGNFTFKNLPVLEKANKDIVEKMKKEAMHAQGPCHTQPRSINSQAVSVSNTPTTDSPVPSLEGSPLLPMPVKRAISVSRGHRPASPSALSTINPSPSRPSQPSSPLLVQFSTGHHHERRLTSSSSQSSSSMPPASFLDAPKDSSSKMSSATPSPIKGPRQPAGSPAKTLGLPQRGNSINSRARSQTLGSQEGDLVPRESFMPGHYKRKSQLFANETSPQSSDNEGNPQAKALLKVQRKRQSSRRMSQITFMDGPVFRPLDVLICEDHPVSKMVMERLFEKLRCRTITASTGPEALRYAVSHIPFDIIFMEYKLPQINGVDVARMIRDTRSANTNTPIVCVTGYLKELPDVHQFNTMMSKPAALPKLTEVLSKYCQWKPPPKDFRITGPLTIPPPNSRADAAMTQDSPVSVASSMAPTMPDSSYKGSSREDSIGSSFFSDLESVRSDEIPVIISRKATEDWHRGGLGISEDIVSQEKPYVRLGLPRLVHTESAPASATTEAPAVSLHGPRRQISIEAIRAKKESLEKKRAGAGGAESGDDEDDELGHVSVRAKSPLNKGVRQSSKLGYEMMRTNSRGSVISYHEDSKLAEPESLRKSLEVLEEHMETLRIPDTPVSRDPLVQQPRTVERSASSHSHPEPDKLEVVRPASRGHITPPVIFPRQPGDAVKEIEMDPDATPVPNKIISSENEPTPKPQGSPIGPSAGLAT